MTIHRRYYWQFAYSLFLIILIPGLLAANTIWLSMRSKDVLNAQVQQEAVLMADTFGASVRAHFGEPAVLQTQIDSILSSNSQVKELTVYRYSDKEFIPLASSSSARMKEKLTGVEGLVAWAKKKSVASLDLMDTTNEQVWSVVTPVTDVNGNGVALLVSKVSMADINTMSQDTFRTASILMFGSIILILLLLVNHFRFVEYAQLFQKMKDLDQMKDDFISVASHELRSPITAVKGYASMLLEGFGGPLNDQGKKYAHSMISSTKRLEDLVADMLDVSRIEQGRMEFNLKEVNVISITEEVADQLRVTAEMKGLKIEHEIPSQQPVVMVDPDRLRQVLFNLIGNAVKYTPKGYIKISYDIGHGKVRILVRDTGVGMTAEARAHLFEKFYRIRNDQTEQITGSGLGLWITRQLIERMKGSITVDSIEGDGSLFTVTFPIYRILEGAMASAVSYTEPTV